MQFPQTYVHILHLGPYIAKQLTHMLIIINALCAKQKFILVDTQQKHMERGHGAAELAQDVGRIPFQEVHVKHNLLASAER